MFSRSFLGAAQPLKMIRRFASGPGSNSSSSTGTGSYTAPLYAVGVAALGGGGCYYFYKNNYSSSSNSSSGSQSTMTTAAAKPAFTGGDQGFLSLKLAEVVDVNHNTKRFRFELPSRDMVPGLPVASAVLARFKGAEDAKATLRPYTPINDENDPGYLELLVKNYPNGPMSNHIHNLKPGQTLDIKGPLPKYAWTANKHDHIGLVAGGTGITPMFQLARGIFRNSDDKTKVTLVFGNLTQDDILLKKELDHLENTYPQRFRAFYVLDKPPSRSSSGAAAGWNGSSGHISKELLKTVLPEPKEANIKIFVCGPPGLMKAISGAKVSPKDQGELTGALKELGYDKEQVYKF